MTKYYMGSYNQLSIAKTIRTNMKRNIVSIHVYYSDFNTPAGLEETIDLTLWNNNWSKLNTKGKKNIIKKKLE